MEPNLSVQSKDGELELTIKISWKPGASMMECEDQILAALNQAGSLATGELLEARRLGKGVSSNGETQKAFARRQRIKWTTFRNWLYGRTRTPATQRPVKFREIRVTPVPGLTAPWAAESSPETGAVVRLHEFRVSIRIRQSPFVFAPVRTERNSNPTAGKLPSFDAATQPQTATSREDRL